MARLCSRPLAAAVAGILWASAIPAQAQHVTFTDVRDAVPLTLFNASATAPDPAAPNTLVIGFESGRAVDAPSGNRVATDTLSFNVNAPPGFYVSSITYVQEGTGSIVRVADARGSTTWVVDNEAALLGNFRSDPSLLRTIEFTDSRLTVVPVSITTSLFAYAPATSGDAWISVDAGHVVVTFAPASTDEGKKTAVIQVEGFTGTFDGAAHGATGTASGVNGEDLSGLLALGESFTNAGEWKATWTFEGDANYNAASGEAAIEIRRADAIVSVTGFSGTYDGASHGASGTATGLPGDSNFDGVLNLGATFTSVPGGVAHWTFSGGTNYNGAEGDVAVTIAKATPVMTWAAPASVVAGTTLSATQLNATADVPGTFVYSPAAGEVLTASRNLSVVFTPTDTTNYNGAAATVPITVTPNTGVQIVNPGSQFGRVGEDVQLRLRVTGTPTSGSFGAFGLPPGLRLDRNEIEGEPTRAGIYVVTIWFTQGGATTSTRFVWTVLPPSRR